MAPYHDPDLEGPGKDARVMIWRDGDAVETQMRWGFAPFGIDGKPISLLRSDRWEIERPCLMLASDFGMRVNGRTRYRASLITDDPFFCIAAMWRSASGRWPEAFAALTVEAYPDIAPYKDRHIAVIRPEHYYDWLMQSRPPADMLEPFPAGSFAIQAPGRKAIGLFG